MSHKKIVLFAMIISGAASIYTSENDNNAHLEKLLARNYAEMEKVTAEIHDNEKFLKHHPGLNESLGLNTNDELTKLRAKQAQHTSTIAYLEEYLRLAELQRFQNL
jgi:hypothetical protein